MALNLGDLFQVRETADLKDGDTVIARYLPGMGYRVTPRNVEFVAELARRGIATPFERPRAVRQAGTATARGTARVL